MESKESREKCATTYLQAYAHMQICIPLFVYTFLFVYTLHVSRKFAEICDISSDLMF